MRHEKGEGCTPPHPVESTSPPSSDDRQRHLINSFFRMPYSSHCINTANLSNSPSSFSSRSPISDLPASFHIVSCIGISMFLRSPPFRGSGTAGSFRSPNSFGLGPFCGRRPPCRRVGRAWYYNRTTAAACTAPHPPGTAANFKLSGTAHAEFNCAGFASPRNVHEPPPEAWSAIRVLVRHRSAKTAIAS